ncbi:MAG: hypothetical protein RBT63_10660 [Bdellovibrionales bacterium]|jgi:hypothetical protein|nr:hypothetical protein [Bdellovibrionales bacterium]
MFLERRPLTVVLLGFLGIAFAIASLEPNLATAASAKPTTAAKKKADQKTIWKMTALMEKPNKVGLPARNKLTFVNRQPNSTKKVEFRPTKPPYGLILEEEVHLDVGLPALPGSDKQDNQDNEHTYFVTGWAHGAATMMFRIFDPETSGSEPICEIISAAENARLRAHKGNVEIEIYEMNDPTPVWVFCSKIQDPQNGKEI